MENNSDPETESTEEEVEPKLKYVRISNDLQNILSKDAVSCIAVHARFLCFGTHWGAIHLLDHQGNKVDTPINKQISQTHMVSVNQISVDNKGEYIASCSDDGMAIINGLYTDENNQKLNIGRAVKSIALDPLHHKPGLGRKFIIGDNKLTLYEKTFLKGLKSTVLNESEGTVSAIAWSDQFVAWASALGVRVHDLNEKCSLGLIKWQEPEHVSLCNYRCNLKWANPKTLLIGWVDTIRVCVVRKRNSVEVATRDLPGYIVDPISTFQTDFYVCGVGPLHENQLVVLGYPKERDEENNKALRPVLYVLEYKTSDYVEICTDSLSLRGYQEYKCNDYHLDCLIEENQYFIVSPKDIVVASLYENDDRIQWFIEHGKYDEAMEVISTHGGRYSIISVARLYLDHLLDLGEYENAAKLCLRAFGNDKQLWEEEVYKFVRAKQLRSVSTYLPRTNDCKLKPHVYEMVLFEYLKLDVPGFLNLIKEWEPTLYNTSAVINAIHDHFDESVKDILLEALAILYSYEKKYEKALSMYLNYQNIPLLQLLNLFLANKYVCINNSFARLQHKDVFDLIKKYDLYNDIHRMIIPLFQLDKAKTISMLKEKNKFSPDIVVQQLEPRQDFLYEYLDALDIDSSGRYHSKLVNLYAKYEPKKLLSFLKRSNNCPIQEALDVCKREFFYEEMVYLLGRMGNTSEALSIIINKLKNIQKAIDFCKEHDDMDLWNDLINQSLDRPDIMTKLLDGIVGYINPEILVNKIKMGLEIPNLKNSLVKMLCDYSLQVSIQDDCNSILVTDYFGLHEKLTRQQQKAVFLSNYHTCGLCRQDIIVKDPLKTNILIFNCRHYFHENCLPDKSIDFCTICKSKKQ